MNGEHTPEFRMCVYHKEHKAIMDRNAHDIQDIWRSIDKMRTWVIIGSGSMVLTLIGIVFQFIIKYVGN